MLPSRSICIPESVWQAKRLAADVSNLQAKNPQSMMLEALHSAGFAGALGQPLVAHPTSLLRLDGQTLFDFVSVSPS